MQKWQRERGEKIADLLVGTHFVAYLLTVAVFIVRMPRSFSYADLSAVLLGFFIPATIFIALDYYFFNSLAQDIAQKSKLQLWNVFKLSGLFLLITYVLAFIPHTVQLQGALYLLPIVLAAIALGRYGGLLFALAASLVLFVLFWSEMGGGVAAVLESVLGLSGVFLLVAWFLGNVLEIEKSTSLRLADLANIDEITDLINHRFFQERLKEMVEVAVNENEPLSLILLDIDNFKKYNESYGHLQGDIVLKKMATVLAQNIPPEAVLARYGGDEFSVILPGIKLAEAGRVANRLRKAVAGKCIPGENGLFPEGLTVSAGIANLPAHATHCHALLFAADEALYNSKVTGKNNAQVYLGILEKIRQTVPENEKEVINSLSVFMTLINAKDRYTYGHSERVAYYIRKLATHLGLEEELIRLLEYGSFLHDIGKLDTPREILNKKSSFSAGDWAIMREHPQWGAEILRPLKLLEPVIPMVLHHHENYDGTGYPAGLRGEGIPYFARMLRIVDSFDAMQTVRPYHQPLPLEKILFELRKGSGREYDPVLVQVFINMLQMLRQKKVRAIRP